MCGIIGISGLDGAARLAYLGLYALQHRGQESAGIVAVDTTGRARIHRGMGLVADLFDEQRFRELEGDVAVGHTRYSTAGSTVLENAQPYLVNYREGPLSLGHNGNLTNAAALREELTQEGAIFQSSSDTEALIHLIARSNAASPEAQIREALERAEGACTIILSVGRTLYAAIDSRGFRPLFLARIGQGVVIASETCAFDLVGASEVRELQPGEFVRVDDGLVTDLAPLRPRKVTRCIFELVYFSRPDSTIFGTSVDGVRRELGRQLARHHPAPTADIVFSVPDSANVMAAGYSEISGVQLEHALIRNHYVGRTFINPTQALRVAKVKIKYNPVKQVIAGKRVVVIDDSLVRGTTSKGLVQMIRAAGAREVHLRLGSPPITGPCLYGIDTPNRSELIAASHSVEEIANYLGVDSLEYLTLDEMVAATRQDADWCHACFSGDYPTPVPDELVAHRWAGLPEPTLR